MSRYWWRLATRSIRQRNRCCIHTGFVGVPLTDWIVSNCDCGWRCLRHRLVFICRWPLTDWTVRASLTRTISFIVTRTLIWKWWFDWNLFYWFWLVIRDSFHASSGVRRAGGGGGGWGLPFVIKILSGSFGLSATKTLFELLLDAGRISDGASCSPYWWFGADTLPTPGDTVAYRNHHRRVPPLIE